MYLLGIDPAISQLGWAVIQVIENKISFIDSGTVKGSKVDKIHKKLFYINEMMQNVILLYNPQIIAMEETFISSNALSSLKLGYVRGALMSLIGQYNIEFYEYKPNHIKKTTSGTGHANKKQMQYMIPLIINNTPKDISIDETDALAVAYTCSIQIRNFKTIVSEDNKKNR
ncbi:crossover junction endodeoxyribonuclease RuvC [Rickettsia endosymbiont of Cardiosporidium cionae]|uniref:crossover junction endodeoxyribonuclease RuvC n=1 Tax=Rickettsia endosymbiont of Cardiosporidium cionae TaxID=2777155 RepID=UPI0018958874|nr:crossover junction endodeoxyribonuclease RuvC [Rickettsia endosymbiont of Cardiosporidium cionae]KAF8818872.1 crossover junction endodeoxyribonuclease RuvC [Rickettsia endosymbiont of Cardiosporidium cionae]